MPDLDQNGLNEKTVCLSRSLGGIYPYEKYRIPGLIATHNDTLLAYFEARMSGSDWADMDIILLRSVDGGETFSEPLVLADGATEGKTVNNPVMVQGVDGVIHFLYCVEYGVGELGGDVFHRQSRDDGKTWSAPVSLYNSTMPDYHNAFALGPGHGICLEDGTLLVPVWLVPKSAGEALTSHHPAEVRVFFSRDKGQSWQLSDKIPQGRLKDPNETTAAELPDGGVMLNIRYKAGNRAVSYGGKDIIEWTTMKAEKALIDPCCFGSSLKYTATDGRRLILFVNCEDRHRRRKLTLKGSPDGGKTWPLRRRITDGEAAYADLCADSGGRIYLMYETDGYQRVVLVRMGIEALG